MFAIGATTFWSASATFFALLGKSHASINDILLLFI
jgi:protein PsiE